MKYEHPRMKRLCRVGRTSEVEPTGESAPTSRNRADEVRLIPPPARTRSLCRTRRHLLLLDLEYGWESGRGRTAAAVAVQVGGGTLSLRGRESIGMAVEEGGLRGIDCVSVRSMAEGRTSMGGGS